MRKHKKLIGALLAVVFVISVFIIRPMTGGKKEKASAFDSEEILNLESRKSFDFFWNEANSDKSSPGYGLIVDRAPGNPEIASIASVGFGLTADAIGAERKWVTYDEAYERAKGTLNTLLNNIDNVRGFFYHFMDMKTGKRAWNSEVSIIDTAIAINGAITAGEYFGGDVKKLADEVYKRVDWEWYRNPGNNQFYMGYSPENGFFGAWDMSAEQFMLYFLGAGSPTHPVNGRMFYAINRTQKPYGFYPPFIQSPAGSIFTYQYSFAWFDFRNKVDKKGVNWWENSIIASKANRQYCINNSKAYPNFGPNSWGVTASDGPNGYSGGYGANSGGNDGTIAPAGAAGSIVFTPKETIDALNYFKTKPELWGPYGFVDAFNITSSSAWYDKDVIGIDKGITLLMIENYRDGFVWNYFMKNEYVQEGMKKAGVVDIGTKVINNLDGDPLTDGSSSWIDGGDKVYNFSVQKDELNSPYLKVDYKKNGSENSDFYIKTDKMEFTGMDNFSAKFNGIGNVKIQLLDSNDVEIASKTFDIKNNNQWNEINWDTSNYEKALGDLNKIVITAVPKDGSASGQLLLKDFAFKNTKPMAVNVLMDGLPVVGKTLTANYDFYNTEGLNEGNTSYKWLISDSRDGDYQDISGEHSKEYTIKPQDEDKFIKCEITPKAERTLTDWFPQSGHPVQSYSIGPIKLPKNVTFVIP